MSTLKRLSLLIAFLSAALLSPGLLLAQQNVTLAGQVTDQKTGEPIAGIEVGLLRAKTLEGKSPRGRVKPEKNTTTNQQGRFEFAIARKTPEIDKVLVFTCAKDRVNIIHPNVKYATQLPTIKVLRQKAVTALNLTQDVAGIHFRLPPPPRLRRTTTLRRSP